MEGIIRIRGLTATDVGAVLAIQPASPEAAAWSRQAYEAISADPARNCCLIAVRDEAGREAATVGFACFRVVEAEAELLNLAVLPAFRRLGIGARLLKQVLWEAAQNGARDLFLEVRGSNLAALSLYKRFGFEMKSRRPGYYKDPPEDALTLHLRLPSPAETR